MRLIGLTGYAQNGKDSAGARLVEEWGYTRFAFADPLKSMALALDPWIPDGYAGRLKAFVAERGWEEAKQNGEVRRFLQVLGTEGVRDHLGVNSWVQATELAMENFFGDSLDLLDNRYQAVITDVRFPNEAEWVHEMGGTLVRINRTNADGSQFDNGISQDHPSEQHITKLPVDLVISVPTGMMEGLISAVDLLAEHVVDGSPMVNIMEKYA